MTGLPVGSPCYLHPFHFESIPLFYIEKSDAIFLMILFHDFYN